MPVLDEYPKSAKTWRTIGDKFQLLLSYINPNVEDGLILTLLKFTLHVYSLPQKHVYQVFFVDDILSRGSWSNESTLKKFFHKQVLSMQQLFQEGVLE